MIRSAITPRRPHRHPAPAWGELRTALLNAFFALWTLRSGGLERVRSS